MKIRVVAVVVITVALLFSVANASTQTFNGYFNDQGNSALVYSDLTAALFGDDYEIVNNIALYSLNIPIAGMVSFDSHGFAAGGADPYFSLFQGSGTSATILGSNYIQAFSTGGDFDLQFDLASGDYMVVMGTFANMSFAENYGSGTLGDKFTGMGWPDCLGNYYYELGVTRPDSISTPEPGILGLIGLGLGGLMGLGRRFIS